MPKTTESSPGPVPVEALNYFRAKNLKPSFSYLDVWKEEHAISFTVAKAMHVDILQDLRNAVDEALAHGKTFMEFQKELIPTLQKKRLVGSQGNGGSTHRKSKRSSAWQSPSFENHIGIVFNEPKRLTHI